MNAGPLDEIRQLARDTVKTYAQKWASRAWWRTPLVTSAEVDDRFGILRKIACSDHMMPWEILYGARSVIVFFVPFREFLSVENSLGDFPSKSWGMAYVETNELIGVLSQRMKEFLESMGYRSATTPPTHNFDPKRLQSKWSHKHLGFLAGLGSFGHNCQLITPSGCMGRLGSLVTEAPLGNAPLRATHEACLHKAGTECLLCSQRCPVGALTADGLDKRSCWERLKYNRSQEAFLGLPETTHVCGKCVVELPCSLTDPVSGEKDPRRETDPIEAS